MPSPQRSPLPLAAHTQGPACVCPSLPALLPARPCPASGPEAFGTTPVAAGAAAAAAGDAITSVKVRYFYHSPSAGAAYECARLTKQQQQRREQAPVVGAAGASGYAVIARPLTVRRNSSGGGGSGGGDQDGGAAEGPAGGVRSTAGGERYFSEVLPCSSAQGGCRCPMCAVECRSFKVGGCACASTSPCLASPCSAA